MLIYTEWQQIKAELKKNIEPVFIKAGIAISIPFEQVLDIFQGVLDKDDVNSSINGRDDIETLLKMVYVDGNIKLAGSTLDVLSGKLEGYLKKVFKIANQPIWHGENSMLAGHLKTVFRVFKQQKNHTHFTNFTEIFVTEFTKPTSSPDYFITAHKLGSHFKNFYSSRNEEGHSYAELGFAEIFSVLESILTTYIYITYLYADTLKQRTIH
ncbi:MAG: hypothetical protein EAZ06_01730 [Cytophagales bacterium]|nr:MAG: hypothetical protein EAZ06_01730 [Cytophagales bacterium]